MCITPKFWEALCEGVGRPDLPADARFRGYKERLVNRDARVLLGAGDAYEARCRAHFDPNPFDAQQALLRDG